ncbi:MAG TPA: PorV/PorQ family protein [candidate division Zixibacteria bacterium]|nr:PorV/PorQ family protein [candidate division Zixibacteria bacterium]
MLIKSITICVVLTGLATAAFGADVDGLSMFKNDHIARAAGMASAVVSLEADPNILPYNPAAAARLEKFTASFGHTEHWENIRFESGHFGVNLFPKWWLHGGIRYAADNDLEKRGVIPTEDPLATFNTHDLSVKTGLAYTINERMSAGISLGWWFEEIEGWRGSAFNVDLGVLYRYDDKLGFGASAVGIGSDLVLSKSGFGDSEDIPLPTVYRIGAHYRAHEYVLAALDLVEADDDFHVHIGVQSPLHEYFTLRAGYMTGYDSKNFTAGASFGMRNITVDYAFVPFSNDLGTSHLFNITFSL